MDKLHKVLKIRRQEEDARAADLARSQNAVVDAESKHGELKDLMEEYRRRHLTTSAPHPARLAEFNRFYSQLKNAVAAQAQIVTELQRVERQFSDAYLVSYRDRLALQKLLEERELAHKSAEARRERRRHIHREAKFFV